MTEVFATLIVSAAKVEAARLAASEYDGGEGMFIRALYTGTEITHYISSGYCSQEIVDAATQAGATNHSGDPYAAIASLGLSLEPV